MGAGDGPFTTTTGFTPTTPGTYNWTVVFSGDTDSSRAASTCGAEAVTVTSGRASQITRADATCSQFAQANSPTLYHVGYALKKGRIETARPDNFIDWLKVRSAGGNQSITVSQFTDEASRPFRLASGRAAFGTGCTTESVTTSQSGGAVATKFDSAGAGAFIYVELRFSTSNVVGEAGPSPHSTVDYLFRTHGSSNELDLTR